MTERKYAMSKVASGDYLLPSNDGQTIWRVARYTDGPSNGLQIPRDRTFWGVWRWMGDVSPGAAVDTEDWSTWEMCGGLCDSRADAVEAALRMRPGAEHSSPVISRAAKSSQTTSTANETGDSNE